MTRARARGLTLLEILVSIAILAMVSVVLYGAFDGLARNKTGLSRMNDRYHTGRGVMRRLAEELSAAFISLHVPINQSLTVRKTAFVVKDSTPGDRLDMTTFSHRRVVANSRECDQAEISYFAAGDPAVSGKTDLVRREAAMIDLEPNKGGTTMVIAEDIDLFDVRLLDPVSGLWTDSWDTTQAIGQPNRLPAQVRVTLVLRGGPGGKTIKFEEKVPLQMLDALSFANPK